MNISKSEANLLDLIDSIRYGSIYDVEIAIDEINTPRSVSTRRQALIKFMREDCPRISEMVVHDGEVTYVTISGNSPFKYVRKVKF